MLHEESEALLLNALQHLPVRYKKLKPHVGRMLIPDQLSLFAVSSDERRASRELQRRSSS